MDKRARISPLCRVSLILDIDSRDGKSLVLRNKLAVARGKVGGSGGILPQENWSLRSQFKSFVVFALSKTFVADI